MPLWKLQTVGDERLDFLYDNVDRGTIVTLKPGVAYASSQQAPKNSFLYEEKGAGIFSVAICSSK